MQTTNSRELVQTAEDGRTRTFRFDRDVNGGPWLHVEIRDADGKSLLGRSYLFTETELEQFRQMAERA